MIVGIDTSCYTTSLAAIDDTGKIFFDSRILLRVKPGEKGLRQSTAVFQHLQNLPALFDQRFAGISVRAVAATVYPRPVPGSYLPVFRVGASFGETMAKLLGVPLIKTSHQEGHIRAGLYLENNLDREILAWHISGGTTELLLVKPEKHGYLIQKVGGTSDLQAGQLVDRVGVALGLDFPAGPALEKMALLSDHRSALPVVTQDLTISFSGPASAAERKIRAGAASQELAREVFNCLGQSLLQVTKRAVRKFETETVLLVGGVASSQIIRETLYDEGQRTGIQFKFGPKELSSDNAVGVGLIGYDFLS